jgi:hypothetical protein
MADELGTDSVTETATTPGSVETVPASEPTDTQTTDTQSETSDPFASSEPWANIDKEPDAPEAEPAKADEPETTDTKTEKPADEKEADAKDKPEEKPLEDQVLDEIFDPEGDKKPEDEKEDLDEQDPEKMIAGQRNATARAWAERQQKMAEPVKLLRYPDKETGEFTPIADVAQKLEEFNPERFAELSQYTAHKLVDTNPEAAFKRAYAIALLTKDPQTDLRTVKMPSLEEVIARGSEPVNAAPITADVPELKDLTADLDKTVDWDWRDEKLDENFVDARELAMAKALRGMEVRVKADAGENQTLKSEVEDLKGKLDAAKPAEESPAVATFRAKLTETIGKYENSVREKLTPYFARNTGLEVSKDDTPEIAAFKQSRMELYTGTEYERANNINSRFESFAYNESTVKAEFETLFARIVGFQKKEADAIIANNTADAAKYHSLADDERIPLYNLLAQANKEFKAKYIDPDKALIGTLSSKLAEPIKEKSERVEVTGTGGGAPSQRPKPLPAETGDDVWNNMVKQSAQDEVLRANA